VRLVYFATSAFALPTLEALNALPHEIVAVVTQPDRPAGRGRHLRPSPIADRAVQLKLPLCKFPSLKHDDVVETLRQIQADIFVVAAYGKLIPQNIFDLPRLKTINLHPSLLPKYRGASPIRSALLKGETITGVSTMFITEALDAGDILMQKEMAILHDDTGESLSDRLSKEGAQLIVETLLGLDAGTITPRPQDEDAMTYAPMLTKLDGHIDWANSGQDIINQVRALQPWPTAHTAYQGKQLKVFWAELPEDRSVAANTTPGTIIEVTRSIHVATGDGRLCLTEVQLEGKTRMASELFLRGHPLTLGEVLA
jgi:methionyl-tRNA formyltransferase